MIGVRGMWRRVVNSLLMVVALVWLAGCASTLPKDITEAPPGNPSVAAVRADPQRFVGAQVRWGGTIAAVENRQHETWIEVVDRPLYSGGRPQSGDSSYGRFLARVAGFLDPAIYAKGRQITVAGTVEGSVTRPIGQYTYRFPVVAVRTHLLWEPLPERREYYDPFWPPYYDPWWPYYRYPYRPPLRR